MTVLRASCGPVFGQVWAGDSFGNDMAGSVPNASAPYRRAEAIIEFKP